MLEYKVTSDAAQQRLDKFLRRRLASVPLSHLYKMVRTKKVRVNGARAEIGQLLQEGDLVSIRGPEAALLGPKAGEPRPPREKPAAQVGQDFGILYEDDAILVCDKPAGLAIHPGSGLTGETLVDQARAYPGDSAISRLRTSRASSMRPVLINNTARLTSMKS